MEIKIPKLAFNSKKRKELLKDWKDNFIAQEDKEHKHMIMISSISIIEAIKLLKKLNNNK